MRLSKYGNLQACLKRIVELRTCSGPRGPERRSTGSRHGVRAGFQGADLDPRTAGVGGVPRVHIDIGVLVHGIAIPMCAPPIPHVAGGVAVAPRPPERRCRPRGCVRGGSDPPFGMPGTASGRVDMCTHLPPSPAGRSRPDIPPGRVFNAAVRRRITKSPAVQPGCLRYRPRERTRRCSATGNGGP